MSTSKERKRSFADRYMDHAGYDPGAIAHQLGVKPPAPTPTVAQKPDGWWRKTYEAMTTPIEKFEYLAGLADLSWHDCQDAWFESRQLIQKIAPYLRELESKAPAERKEPDYEEIMAYLDAAGEAIDGSTLEGDEAARLFLLGTKFERERRQ